MLSSFKREYTIGLAAAGVGLAALIAIAVGASAAAKVAPGCYERVYDAAHLSAHPKQKVIAIRLSLSNQRTGGEGPGVLPASLFFRLRGSQTAAGHALHGYCDDRQAVLRCKPEWEAGTWRIEPATDGGVLVRNGDIIANPANFDAEEIAPGAVRLPARPDDRSWKLAPAPAAACENPR